MPCCGDTGLQGIMRGLGALAQATELAELFVNAKNAWHNIENIFGIGAGRHEADVVVPLQNDVHHALLAPVSDFLTAWKTPNHGGHTCAELQVWQGKVLQGETQWLNFLHNTEWQDGRAAQQAEATLAPYFNNAKTDIARFLSQDCGGIGGGIGGIITDEQGNLNWPVIALGGAALYLITRKRG